MTLDRGLVDETLGRRAAPGPICGDTPTASSSPRAPHMIVIRADLLPLTPYSMGVEEASRQDKATTNRLLSTLAPSSLLEARAAVDGSQ